MYQVLRNHIRLDIWVTTTPHEMFLRNLHVCIPISTIYVWIVIQKNRLEATAIPAHKTVLSPVKIKYLYMTFRFLELWPWSTSLTLFLSLKAFHNCWQHCCLRTPVSWSFYSWPLWVSSPPTELFPHLLPYVLTLQFASSLVLSHDLLSKPKNNLYDVMIIKAAV